MVDSAGVREAARQIDGSPQIKRRHTGEMISKIEGAANSLKVSIALTV
jgi:hypothetical protein